MYILAYINGLAPIRTLLSHLHSLPFPSRRWQPIARSIWRAHHHHDSLLSQSEEYPIALYVCMFICMYVSMFVYMYVYYVYLCLKECMCYLVQMMSNSDYRKVSDNQPMIGLHGPGKTLPCLNPNPLLLLSTIN